MKASWKGGLIAAVVGLTAVGVVRAEEPTADAASADARANFAEAGGQGAVANPNAGIAVDASGSGDVARTALAPASSCAGSSGEDRCVKSRDQEPPVPAATTGSKPIMIGNVDVGETTRQVSLRGAVLYGGYALGGPATAGVLGVLMLFGW